MGIEELLAYAIILGVPGLVSLFFAISIIKFFTTDKEDTVKRSIWKILLIIASALQVILVISVIALIILLMTAMSHM